MKRQSRSKTLGLILLLAGAAAWGQDMPQQQPPQQPPPGQGGPPRQGPPPRRGPGPPQPGRPPLERAMGQWWNNPQMVEKLGVTDDQKKKMQDIFQQHRLKLIDLNASLQKAEAILEPLIGADQPDEAKIVAQIDRVAQARAELEKENARMLLGIRQTLTADQWKKLQQERPGPAPASIPRLGGPGRPPNPPQQ